MQSVVAAAAAVKIFFYGAFAHDVSLQQEAQKLFVEYKELGYTLPSSDEPLEVRQGTLPAGRAGVWQSPSTIILSDAISDKTKLHVFLRHELIHVLVNRNCRLPLWAQEAAAMAGSGELREHFHSEITPQSFESLKLAVKNDYAPSDMARNALAGLILKHGWPTEKCGISSAIRETLVENRKKGQLSWRLIHLMSGQLLASSGSQHEKVFPGSLLKVPVAASLRFTENKKQAKKGTGVGQALALSDSNFFMEHMGAVDHNQLSFLLKQNTQKVQKEALLGLRWGREFISFSLKDLAHILRLSILTAHENFIPDLAKNGELPDSTLKPTSSYFRRFLRQNRIAIKTGTTRNADSLPISGTAAAIWPSDNPQFLALVSEDGVAGFQAAERQAALIESWVKHLKGFGNTNTLLLLNNKVPAQAFAVSSPCKLTIVRQSQLEGAQTSVCGTIVLTTAAKGVKSRRTVSGLVAKRGKDLFLLTDVFSYADGVLAAEAATELRGEARHALQAVVVSNALAHNARTITNNLSNPLCSSTRCMAFQGNGKNELLGHRRLREKVGALVAELEPAVQKLDGWLPFALGGSQSWVKDIKADLLASLVAEKVVLAVTRERMRRGQVRIHLEYMNSRETVSCEVFRNRLKLLSCPDRIEYRAADSVWRFSGMGEGHGAGLQMLNAQRLSDEGASASTILKKSFQLSGQLVDRR